MIIASTDNLEDVHIALQIAMGWSNSHLHEFANGVVRYGVSDEDFPSDIRDEVEFRMDQSLKKEKESLIYSYDFGDGWEHEVALEKILPFVTDAVLPRCIEGSRACQPEDVGGIPGCEMFLETVSDEQSGEHFDPEYFDLAGVNGLLREATGL